MIEVYITYSLAPIAFLPDHFVVSEKDNWEGQLKGPSSFHVLANLGKTWQKDFQKDGQKDCEKDAVNGPIGSWSNQPWKSYSGKLKKLKLKSKLPQKSKSVYPAYGRTRPY